MTRLFDALKIRLAFRHDDSVTVDVTSVKEEDHDVHLVRAFGPQGTKLYTVRLNVYDQRYVLFDYRGVQVDEGECLMDLMDYVEEKLRF